MFNIKFKQYSLRNSLNFKTQKSSYFTNVKYELFLYYEIASYPRFLRLRKNAGTSSISSCA